LIFILVGDFSIDQIQKELSASTEKAFRPRFNRQCFGTNQKQDISKAVETLFSQNFSGRLSVVHGVSIVYAITFKHLNNTKAEK